MYQFCIKIVINYQFHIEYQVIQSEWEEIMFSVEMTVPTDDLI